MKIKMIKKLIPFMSALILAACANTNGAAENITELSETVSESVSESQADISASAVDLKSSDDKNDTEKNDPGKTGTKGNGGFVIELETGSDITLDSAGTYEIKGSAENVTITVDAGDEDEVCIVLSGINAVNKNTPFIYVKNAGKTIVSTADGSKNAITVSEEFDKNSFDGANAAIFSKDDLELSGGGKLSISSSGKAVDSNDTLKITDGQYDISSTKSAFRANDQIEVSGGSITVSKCTDGLHAENDDDTSEGSIVITGGVLNITADDDAVHATTTIKIDDGELTLTAAEGIEGTDIRINGGNISISASDDGINAAAKSDKYSPVFELTGGNIVIKMGAGDTDGVDSNGDIYIKGGTIDITGQSTFDYDGKAEYTGGTIIENGKETNTISNQQFGPGMKGGQRPEFQDGQMPKPQDGQMPEFQEGERPAPPEGERTQRQKKGMKKDLQNTTESAEK